MGKPQRTICTMDALRTLDISNMMYMYSGPMTGFPDNCNLHLETLKIQCLDFQELRISVCELSN